MAPRMKLCLTIRESSRLTVMATFMLLNRGMEQSAWSPKQVISMLSFLLPFLIFVSSRESIISSEWPCVWLPGKLWPRFETNSIRPQILKIVMLMISEPFTFSGLVTTIAGGSNWTGHNDGEGSDVTFSNDFEATYLHSTCTLAIADRGNRMIREIQLPHFIGRCSGTAPNSPESPFKSRLPMKSHSCGVLPFPLIGFPALSLRHTSRLESVC